MRENPYSVCVTPTQVTLQTAASKKKGLSARSGPATSFDVLGLDATPLLPADGAI